MPILPPATIGILGGGQLGRMTALAARSMGFGVQVLDPGGDCAARPVVDRVVVAPFDDVDAARDLARACGVITLEIEQIAPAVINAASEFAPVRPGVEVIRIVQDRERQKGWLSKNGFPAGPYMCVGTAAELAEAHRALGGALFVKASEGGFDGRSQVRMDRFTNAEEAFASIGARRAVAERALDLALELSVLVARRPSGETVVYPPAQNHHENQILAWSMLPGEIDERISLDAQALATEIAHAISLEGILAVEMFLLRDGRLLVNELAPRPHNSYHASELASATSQFEQIVRAVCDLPLGSVETVMPSAIVNLFGDLWIDGRAPNFASALEVPGTRLFLYGKSGARAGRKMGHLGASAPTAREALRIVQYATARL